MNTHPPFKHGFLIPRIAVALSLFCAAAFLALYSVASESRRALPRAARSLAAPSVVSVVKPPFPPVENKVTNGGLTVLARVFAAAGKVKPGETFPLVLTYEAGATGATGVSITVTLHPAALFVQSTPAAASGNGAAATPLVYTIPLVAPNGTGQIVIEARAKDLTEDPEVMWKDLSSDVTLAAGGEAALPARTHGPKVTTLESAVYGDRPFPLVMVQYQDIKHCTAAETPYPECTGNHTSEALTEAMNSRTSGKSVWQLYQDMSFGQLFPDARVSPLPNTPTTPFTTGYVHKFSTPMPNGTCTGTTVGPAYGLPIYANRIENGWYLLPGTQGYYGADRTGHALLGAETGQGVLFGIDDACGPTGKLAYDAASIADPDIDYNDFDTDKDGVVDFFNIVFAGDGGNLSVTPTGLNNVWPHSSDLRYNFRDTDGQTGYVSNDQFRNRLNQLVYFTDASRSETTTTPTAFPMYVRVGSYNVNPEAAMDSVSVIAHEYGHSLGLPDFYSTGSRSTFGSWELMGSDYFQYMTAFSRQDMGWVVPRPLPSGPVMLRESKYDTGEIHWTRPDGTPYTLTGPGIHNADVYRVGLPPRILIDEVPSGVRAWYSGAGNDFGCSTDGRGRNMDLYLPDLQQHGSATAITLKMKHLYEIEWDYDYAFVLVSEDGGRTWKSLPAKDNTTTPAALNRNANGCQTAYGNSFTGVSDGDPTNDPVQRVADEYPPAQFVPVEFDMTAYKGKNVIVRFSYATDPGLAKRGWFIDDVEITADNTVVYASDFETSEERTRLFPKGWVRVSSAEGSPADHAYYIELRDRINNDANGKGQSDRGAITWEAGVSMIYTDEAHGYGNFGVDDPPAQTPVDSNPEPGNETPNLNDAAFTMARPTFNGCTHFDNYDINPLPDQTEPHWKLPPYLNFTVTSITGLVATPSEGLPASPATATLNAQVYPVCVGELPAPVLAVGTDYENPDTDGVYHLTWTRTGNAVGPDTLQFATSCGPTFSDDASEPLVAGENAKWKGSPQWITQVNPDDNSTSYYIPDGAEQNESLTMKTAVAIPAGFTSTLTFTTRQGLEAEYDFGFVEVSTNGGTSFKAVRTDSGPGELPNQVFSGTRTVDLTEFAGQSVLVRFRVTSDGYNLGQPAGWYIDNIQITNSNWADLATTSATSAEDRRPSGSYCYRVQSRFAVGNALLPGDFSNIVNVTVAPGVVPPPPPGPGTFRFSQQTYDAGEDGGNVTITVVRQGGSAGTVSVDYATSNGSATAGSDYTATSGTLTFAPSEVEKTFTVSVLDDATDEDDETVNLTLTNATNQATIAAATATLRIIDNDTAASEPGTFQFSQATYDAGENDGTATIKVVREGGSSGTVTVDYSTSNGSATAGSDYTATSGTLTFQQGELEKTFTVSIADDTTDEDDETVNLTLSNPTNQAKLGAATAILRIIDNETPPGDRGTVQFSAAQYSAGENAGAATITVSRTGGTAGSVSVSYATSDGTATAGGDYTSASGTLTFADGETTKTFTVSIIDDTTDENDETVNLTLSNVTNPAKLGAATATLKIIDNDTPPAQPGTLRFSAAEYSAGENAGSATITVGRVGGNAGSVSVSYATSDGTATAGSDYTSASGTLTFADGETTKTFSVPLIDSPSAESDETVLLTLSNATGGATLGSPSSATLTIVDSDTSGPPAQLLNISTRLRVQGGEKVGIGGLIITGNNPKRVVFRGIGPSLSVNGEAVAGRLQDPVIELYDGNGVFIASNDNWIDSPDRAEIEASGLAPSNDAESAIARTVTPGAYTVMVFGKGEAEGIALVEAYDRDQGGASEMANISTRGVVGSGDDVLIGGFIAGARSGATNVVVRAIGPSLSNKGVTGALQDPTIELVNANGQTVDASDDWKTSPDSAKISAMNLAPSDDRESAALHTLTPGNYTAIVRGKGQNTGIALVEIYNVQ